MPPYGDFHRFEHLFLRRLFFLSVLYHFLRVVADLRYIINLNDKDAEQRNKFIEKMAGLGVATNVHYKPLPMHTGYKKLGFKIEDYPNAYKQFKNVVTLPLHTCLSDEDVDYVIECMKECLK